VAAFAASLTLLVGATGCGGKHASAGPPIGLSKGGAILWQFEALLHDTFRNNEVCASGRLGLNFTGGLTASNACTPLAVYSPYFYVFAHARHSAFHISSKKEVGGFGNYPQPVLIRHHPIACNRRETQFLIVYPDAISFTVGCSRAGYVVP